MSDFSLTDFSPSTISASPIIIQNAQVLLPSGEITRKDVAIADGKITAVGTGLEVTADTQTIDGEGLTMLPGVIDPHVHFCNSDLANQAELSAESYACVKGGITSFLEMPNTLRPTTTPAILTENRAIAARTSLINYGFFYGVCINVTDQHSPASNTANLDTAKLQTEESICGLKLCIESAHPRSFLSNAHTSTSAHISGSAHASAHTGALTDDTDETNDIANAIEPIFREGTHLIAVDTSRQADILAATQTALHLSKKYERRLHFVTVSTGAEAELLQAGKPSWVSAEVTPQHLLLDVHTPEAPKALKRLQPKPPLGTKRDREQLWQALLSGAIDFIGTAHTPSPHPGKNKGHTRPTGIPGVETSLALMLTQAQAGRCTVAQVANWMSTAIARAYNIPKKGLIKPGYDADLVLVDLSTYRPVRAEELATQCGWSPFEGWTLTGWPMITLLGGHVVYNHGDVKTSARGQALQFDAN